MESSKDDFLSMVPTSNSTDDPMFIILNFLTSDITIQFILVNLYGFLLQVFVLPWLGILLFIILMYGGALGVYKIQRIRQIRVKGYSSFNKDEARQAIHTWMYWVSKIWFAFESYGLESIPTSEQVLFIGNRGIFPTHYGGLFATLANYRKNRVFGVVDDFHRTMPVFNSVFQHIDLRTWLSTECIQILNDGSDLVITPGGPKEKRDADEHYIVDFGTDTDFAKIAKDAKVQIVPFFCVNLLESFWMPFFVRPFFRGLFTPKDFYFALSGGGLPVKLTVVFGKPIPCDKLTNEEIIEATKKGIEELRDKYQRLPGNKLQAIIDRLRRFPYKSDLKDSPKK